MKIRFPKTMKAGAIIVAITMAAVVSYEVRALLAALLIFTVVFVAGATAWLILLLIQDAALWCLSLPARALGRVRGGRGLILANKVAVAASDASTVSQNQQEPAAIGAAFAERLSHHHSTLKTAHGTLSSMQPQS